MSDAFWNALFGNLPGTLISLGSLIGVIYSIRVALSVNHKVDGIMSRAEDRALTARAETTVSRLETADARVAGAEDAGTARAEGVVAGAKQERDNPTK